MVARGDADTPVVEAMEEASAASAAAVGTVVYKNAKGLRVLVPWALEVLRPSLFEKAVADMIERMHDRSVHAVGPSRGLRFSVPERPRKRRERKSSVDTNADDHEPPGSPACSGYAGLAIYVALLRGRGDS